MGKLVGEINSQNDYQFFMPIGGILNRSYSFGAQSSASLTHFLPAPAMNSIDDVQNLTVEISFGKRKIPVIPATCNDVGGICVLELRDLLGLFSNGYYDRNAVPKTNVPLPPNSVYFMSHTDIAALKYQPESVKSINDVVFYQVNKPVALGSIIKSAKKVGSSAKKSVEFINVQTPVATTTLARKKASSSSSTASSGCTSVDTASTYSSTSSGGNVSVSLSPLALVNSLVNTEMKYVKTSPRSTVHKVLHRANGPSNYAPHHELIDNVPHEKWSHYWPRLKAIGWHNTDFKHDEAFLDMYTTPHSSNSTRSGISVKSFFENGVENLNYFVSKKSVMDLMESNPCYNMDFFDIWEMMKGYGWTATAVTFKQAKSILKQVDPMLELSIQTAKVQELYTYKYVPPANKKSGWTPIIGLHTFNNDTAVLQYISRFPYLLQEDEAFATTLELQQFTKVRKDVYMFTPFGSNKAVEMSTQDIRHELWLRPALLYQNLSLDYKSLTDMITIPYEKALEFVTNTIKIGDVIKVSEASHVTVLDLAVPRTVDTPAAVVPSAISPITPIYDSEQSSEIKKLAEELQKLYDTNKYVKLSQLTKWPVFPITELSLPKLKPTDWYVHEKVVVNRLSITFKDPNEWEVGIDYFFSQTDIIHYLAQFGCMEVPVKSRSYRNLRNVVDYSDITHWNRQRRIKDLASQLTSCDLTKTEFVSFELLTKYLEDEKWVFKRNHQLDTVTIFPPWNVTQDCKGEERKGSDYFHGDIEYGIYCYPDVISHILTYGSQLKPGATDVAVVANSTTTDMLQAVNDLVSLVADIKSGKVEKKDNSKNTVVGDYMKPLGWRNGSKKAVKGAPGEPEIIVAPWIVVKSPWRLETDQLVEDKDYILRENIWDVVGIKYSGRISREDLFSIKSAASALKRKIPIMVEDDIPIVTTSVSNKKGKSSKATAVKEAEGATVSNKKGKNSKAESTSVPKKKAKASEAPVTPRSGDAVRSEFTNSPFTPDVTLKVTLDEVYSSTIMGINKKNHVVATALLDLKWLQGHSQHGGSEVMVPEWTQKRKCWNKTNNILNTSRLTEGRDYVMLDNVLDFVKRHNANVLYQDIYGVADVVTESDGTPEGRSNQTMPLASPTSPLTPEEELVWVVHKLKNDPESQSRSKNGATCQALTCIAGWVDGYAKGSGLSILIPPWVQRPEYYSMNKSYQLDITELMENKDYIMRDNVWNVVNECSGRVWELRREIFAVTGEVVVANKSKKAKVAAANESSDVPELQLHHKSPTKELLRAPETDSHFERLTNASSRSPDAYQSNVVANGASLSDTVTLREMMERTKSAFNGNSNDTLIGRVGERNSIHNHIVSGVTSREGRSVYVCGSPGAGKTLTVATVLDSFFCGNKYVVTIPETNAREEFAVCRAQGTAVDAASVYSELAQNLGIQADSEAEAKVLVTNRFRGVTGNKGKRKNGDSNTLMTVLIIDEIDKLSDIVVNELIECTKVKQSSLILIGIANTLDYVKDKEITDTIIFSSYDVDNLKLILLTRFQGLATAGTCDQIARKLLKSSSDIRQLSQVARQSLQEAASTIIDDVLDAPWDKRDIITAKHVTAAMSSLGMGGQVKIGLLSQVDKFARCLLVSLIIEGITSTNVAEIVPIYNAYSQSKGLGTKSKDEVRDICEQLSNCNLLAGGPKRSSGRRADNDTCTYMVEVTAEQAMKCVTIEKIHQESLQNYLNRRSQVEEDFL